MSLLPNISGGVFSGPNVIDSSFVPVNNGPTAITTSIKYVLTNSIGCSDSTELNVTVSPRPAAPTISLSGPNVFCEGDSVKLYIANGDMATWNGMTMTDTVTATADSVFYAQFTSPVTGCISDSSAPVTVTVNPTLTNTLNESICSNESYAFNGNSLTVAGSYSATFTSLVTGCDSVVTLNLTVNPISQGTVSATICEDQLPYNFNGTLISALTGGPYFDTLTSATGCDSIVTLNLTVTPTPTAPTITPGGTVDLCFGEDTVLTASGATGSQTYLWSNASTTTAVTVGTADTYTVQVVDQGCFSLASAATTVNVSSPIATPTVTPVGPVNICAGESTTLTAAGATGTQTYLWNNSSTTSAITVSTTGTYTVQIQDGNCTSAASTGVVVNVSAIPATPTIAGNTTYCSGTAGSTLSSSVTGDSYIWTGSTVTSQSITAAAGTYTVQVVENACTSAVSAPVTTAETATPTVTVSPAQAAIDNGESVTLTASGATTYNWSSGETTAAITVSPTVTSTFTVTGQNGACTSAPASVLVTVNDIVVRIPTGFSPNGDGENDTWQIEGINQFPAADVKVINRWGQTIFEKNGGYTQNWDGDDMPSGTYYYVVDFKDGNGTKTGTITIVR